MKYVLVTGGVVSGLGKGVTASSIGVVLKACGLRVTSIKIDPYLNTDAGTMSPFEHGEVFVLDDGGEVDLDLGNYERFLDVKLTRDNNITTGKIYQSVIDKERKGDYLGKTVQVVPHITDAIQEWIERVAMIPVDGKDGPADVCVIELGGTIGDIESMPFIEALGQFSYRVGPGNFCLVHVSLVPVLSVVGEQKTKPTQHSVRGLRGLGLTPNILACRSVKPLDENVKEKLSQFCHVPAANIITLYDVTNIWRIPLLLRDQKAHEAILTGLNLQGVAEEPMLKEWTDRAEICDTLQNPVRIAMVGKYTGLSDSYLSVLKALLHASVACRRKLIVEWVPAADLEDTTAKEAPTVYEAAWNLLKGAYGILVPGGFGDRGVQGKILAAKYARENNIPYLGICLGMQIAVIEFARSVLNLQDANSTEFDPDTTNPCVIFMPEGSKTHMGGTMRLGSRRTYFQVDDCKSAKLYGDVSYVDERHRHRYEVNPDMITKFESAGLAFVGKDESGKRMEVIELWSHPYYVGVQFHPEFKSRPGKPSALFLGHLCDASNYNILDFEIARKHELWMVNYGRVYKDEAEKARRFEIYKENIKYIEDFNSIGDHKYTLGEGPFTDLTTEEFFATYTGGIKASESEIEESLSSFEHEAMQPLNYSSLPASKNWTAEGAVTYVKWQRSCGSCWAFTAVAAVESLTKIKKRGFYNLSPQQLIDCDTSNKGCKGGWLDKAFDYIKNHKGITTEVNYPYKGVKGTCDVVKANKTVAIISGYVRVPRNNESALMAAVAQQPVAVSIKPSKAFQDYKKGIFTGTCGTVSNHTVLVVGYGKTGSDEYWILKNSWGHNWGEAGYMRLKKNTAAREGLCGIAIEPMYPKI